MPKALEEKLKTEARKKFPGDKARQNRYVFGTLRKEGWAPARKKARKKTARKKKSRK